MRGRTNSSFTMSMQTIRRSAANLYDRDTYRGLKQPPGGSPRNEWWSQTESNRRHPACKAGALPTELWPHFQELARRAVSDRHTPIRGLVGPGRLELPTLRLSGVRSNHLSYGPMAVRQAGNYPRLAITPSTPKPVRFWRR